MDQSHAPILKRRFSDAPNNAVKGELIAKAVAAWAVRRNIWRRVVIVSGIHCLVYVCGRDSIVALLIFNIAVECFCKPVANTRARLAGHELINLPVICPRVGDMCDAKKQAVFCKEW